MSEIAQCPSCKGDFENQVKVPMLLPCEHNICYTCVINFYQKNMKIKCFKQNCQEPCNLRPSQLKEDIQLLKHLEQKGVHDNIALLENKKNCVEQARAQLTIAQNTFFQQLVKHINLHIFKENITLQRQASDLSKEIKQQLKYLKIQYYQMINQGNYQQLSQQSLSYSQFDLKISQLLADTLRVVQQNTQVSTKVYEDLVNVTLDLNNVIQENSNVKNQMKQLNSQIKSLQQENFQLQVQIKTYENENQILNQLFQQAQQSSCQIENQNIIISIISPNNKKVKLIVQQKTTIGQIKDKIQQQTNLYA